MSELPDEAVVCAIKAANYVQAHIWEQALRDAGVRCRVVGDNLTASFGGIPGLPGEIWVLREDREQARKVLEAAGAVPEEWEPEAPASLTPGGEQEP